MSTHVVTLSCHAEYSDGSFLFDGEDLVCDTKLQPFGGIDAESTIVKEYQCVTIQIAVPRAQAEAFLEGLRTGKVELYIDSMKSLLEQS